MVDIDRPKRISYEERASSSQNPLVKKLFGIMTSKQSNLCLAPNLKTIDETLELVDIAGPHICILKTQCRGFGGSQQDHLRKLYEKKKQYNFLLFEDDKFVDLDHTNNNFYGTTHILYADLVTVMPDEQALKGLSKFIKEAEIPADEYRGFLSVCETSYKTIYNQFTEENLQVSEKYKPECCGIIAQKLQLNDVFNMFKASPGVHISQSGDGGAQNWNHPSKVVANGADVVIVGRGIVSAPKHEWLKTTLLYKEVSWKAYEDDLRSPSN